ncbi:hypothetical protein ACRAKI_19910 [Saccharothrix isguenensis]
MDTPVILVAGLGAHVVAGEVRRALPGSVLVRHDLSGRPRAWCGGVSTGC